MLFVIVQEHDPAVCPAQDDLGPRLLAYCSAHAKSHWRKQTPATRTESATWADREQ